jgi:regulatory protein YycI of two-component signal transduction system YycFG
MISSIILPSDLLKKGVFILTFILLAVFVTSLFVYTSVEKVHVEIRKCAVQQLPWELQSQGKPGK